MRRHAEPSPGSPANSTPHFRFEIHLFLLLNTHIRPRLLPPAAVSACLAVNPWPTTNCTPPLLSAFSFCTELLLFPQLCGRLQRLLRRGNADQSLFSLRQRTSPFSRHTPLPPHPLHLTRHTSRDNPSRSPSLPQVLDVSVLKRRRSSDNLCCAFIRFE